MSNPFFSIIIPAYNVEKYIGRTLQSFADQVFKDFEIIVINDGSSDQTADVVNSYSHKFNHCQLVNQTNQGVSCARNNGIDHSSGKYIIFFDGDDFVEPDYLMKLNVLITANNSDIAFCAYNKVDESGIKVFSSQYLHREYNHMSYNSLVLEHFFANNMLIWTGCAVYRKTLITQNNLRFNHQLSYGEDQEFTAKALYHAYKISATDQVLAYYLQRESGAVGNCRIHKIRDNIKAYSNLLRFFKNKNETKYSSIMAEFKIPYNIVSVLRNYAKRENRMEFDRILSKRILKSYLLKGLFGSKATIQLRVKILLILLMSDLFYFLISKKVLKI